ncbi:mannosyltransferase [Thecaphora frezii]
MLVVVLLAFCATLILLISLLFFALYIALYRAPSTTSRCSLGRSAAVVVLGDIGRSPRMCFHVESLANEGWKVAVVGYRGTLPPPPLRRPSIKHHHLRTPPAFIARLPRAAFALVAPIKVLYQSLSLFWQLAAKVQPPPEIVLVQTPPALPTLFVVRLVCALLGSRVIIDWHNLGYTILALRMGPKSPLVRLAERLECITGRKAFAHLFVTNAMMKHLDRHWGLEGRKAVLHDRPPAHFRRSTTDQVHELMTRLAPQIRPSLQDFYPPYSLPDSTPFTRLWSDRAPPPMTMEQASPSSPDGLRPDSPSLCGAGQRRAYFRDDRPALVVSSTSWTADEDFTLLLHAARIYERRARELAARASVSQPSQSESFFGGDQALSSPVRENARMTRGDSHSSLPSSSSDGFPSLSLDGEFTRTSKERRRPSVGTLRSATLPNEPAASLPKMVIVVTGKGELKASYEAEIRRLETEERWEWVRIRTAWLESEDYPVLLGSADVGISLHTSSSGIDLPMKVVDMLGCGLPVCALDFACLDELIHDGHNGLVFRDAEGLARQLESLLALHPTPNWLLVGAGMQNPFEPPTASGSASGSPRMGGGGPRFQPSQPTPPSPNSSFTLLHSPSWPNGPSGWPKPVRTRTSTWEGNWKTTIRPILHAADLERERKNGRKPDANKGPAACQAQGASSALGIAGNAREEQRSLLRQRRQQQQQHDGVFLLSDSDEDYADDADHDYGSGGAQQGTYQSAWAGTTTERRAGEEPQQPVREEGIAHAQDVTKATRLRHRVSVRQTPNATQLLDVYGPDGDLDLDGNLEGDLDGERHSGTGGKAIPHIQVSHPGSF